MAVVKKPVAGKDKDKDKDKDMDKDKDKAAAEVPRAMFKCVKFSCVLKSWK